MILTFADRRSVRVLQPFLPEERRRGVNSELPESEPTSVRLVLILSTWKADLTQQSQPQDAPTSARHMNSIWAGTARIAISAQLICRHNRYIHIDMLEKSRCTAQKCFSRPIQSRSEYIEGQNQSKATGARKEASRTCTNTKKSHRDSIGGLVKTL